MVTSTKSMTGHLLGGAGALESVFSVLAAHHRIVPPTINIENLDPEVSLSIANGAPVELPQGDLAVLNNAFGEATLAVDTHVFRVANRTGLAPGRTPLEVELRLLERVPDAYLPHAHHWLILHGRYVCVARRPLCWQCAVSQWCDYEPKTAAPA